MGSINTPEPLKVGIIGAGIAGLGTAVALRNKGHHVEIFEQSRFKYEIGAAITLPPNGVVAIKELGIDLEQGKPIVTEHYHLLAGDTLQTKAEDDTRYLNEQYGNYMYNFSRVELHDLLRREAVKPNREGVPVAINLGCKTTDVNAEEGIIVLEDGRSVQKDLVVIADGVHTKFTPAICGKSILPTKNGRSAFRGLIPFPAIHAHRELGPYFRDNVKPGFWIPSSPDHSVHVVTYPCGQTPFLNLVVLHYTLPKYADAESWTTPADNSDCVAAAVGFHPIVHELLKLSSDTKVHTLHIKEPLPTLVKGRAVIIGDAAAPHQPQLAQGASTALMCAAALGMVFDPELRPVHPTSSSAAAIDLSVQARLDHFNKVLHHRSTLAQLMSDAIPYNPNDPFKVQQRQRLEELAVGHEREYVLPPTDHPPLGPMVRDVLYGYDVVKGMKAYLGEQGLVLGR
ncbi:FAD-dependent urate hydroxylase [Cyphellophora attinorum]|uniref:FAD-dependent urate hydroxylase n=1 Tax=Cyphellophora attinorum TaxID=1664694 RepID=A0A0N0NS45_9EURO|nr:FAD-dependent urate hydroxylase [Phialophora attinorum]KPI45831.1 FAD-dependent urate hydroxylase [Phialophora attinorum]